MCIHQHVIYFLLHFHNIIMLQGFTTGRPADARGKPTVLLQREDYAVRHFDADGGEEVWKVEVGRFSALDFDADAHQSSADRDQDEMTEDPVVIGGRRRGAAATAASIGKDKQRSDFSPILGGGNGRNKFGSFRHEPEFESDDFNYHDTFNYEQSNFRAFPSVAFGEVRDCRKLTVLLVTARCTHKFSDAQHRSLDAAFRMEQVS
jgi:hypothetical protein